MRKIKFKALDKEAKRIYDVISIYWDENGEITSVLVNDDGFVMELLLDDIELLQYIGQKDKSGKEVYEGNTIKRLSNVFDDSERNAVVEWDDDTASFVYHDRNGKHWINFKSDIDSNIEVVDNVNPEILK